MPQDKVVSMRDAVARFVPDSASVCMCTALEALIPFAAGHELIRQRRRALTLTGPISDIKIAAVVHEPFGAYPSPVQGYYGRGHDFYHRYHEETRTLEGTRVKTPRLSEPLDFGA